MAIHLKDTAIAPPGVRCSAVRPPGLLTKVIMIKKTFFILLLAAAAFALLSQVPSVLPTAQAARPTPAPPPIATPTPNPRVLSSN